LSCHKVQEDYDGEDKSQWQILVGFFIETGKEMLIASPFTLLHMAIVAMSGTRSCVSDIRS
jgi:hypothetical protein